MAILLVLVNLFALSIIIYFPKVGYSDQAVDLIHQRKMAVNPLQQL